MELELQSMVALGQHGQAALIRLACCTRHQHIYPFTLTQYSYLYAHIMLRVSSLCNIEMNDEDRTVCMLQTLFFNTLFEKLFSLVFVYYQQ